MNTPDYLVVGGGIIGVSVALELRRRYAGASVALIDKEPEWGRHASGRNSGVLHAGFYYTSDSLKARFTREGNRQLTEYCVQRGLPINRCGKVVVARNAGELAGLDELLRRGRANGVALEDLNAAEVRRLEPRAITYERGLFSPTTASVDPGAVLRSLVLDARSAGVELFPGTAYLARSRTAVRTSTGVLTPGYVVNTAGAYADRVAHDWGFGKQYRILPFRGLYLQAEPASPRFRTHIYPVPNLAQPFLGVHVTVGVGGRIKLGPTATPAFWREHYGGLRGFSLSECASIVARETSLFVRNDFDFRRLALEELRKYNRRHLVSLAAQLADGIQEEHFRRWGRPGIRAQLIDINARRLEMDFKFEGDDRSFHVLNTVSPGFTCALPFAAYLVDQVGRLRGHANPVSPPAEPALQT